MIHRICFRPALAFCLAVSVWPVSAAIVPSLGDEQELFEDKRVPAISRVQIDTSERVGSAGFDDLDRLLQQGDAQALITRAKNVLAQQPESGLAQEVLGVAWFSLGNLEGAAAAFTRATEVEPEQAGPWAKLGIVQMAQGNRQAALTSLQKAIELDPSNRFAHQRLGMLYEDQGDTALAMVHYRAGLLGAPPDYLGVGLNLAELQNRAGEFAASVALLEPRVPLSSASVDAHLALAKAYLETKRVDDAALRYRRAMELDPESERAALGLAAALRESGAAGQSLARIDAVLQRNPESLRAHLERGGTLLALDRQRDAYAAYDRAIELGADTLLVRKRVAAQHLMRKEYDQAEALYAGLVDQGIADEDSYGRLAELQFAGGDASAATQTLRGGLRRYPDSAALHLRLGSLQASMGNYEDSLVDLEQAYRLAPTSPLVLRTYSLALTRAGDTAAAARIAGELYRARNGNPADGLIYTASLHADGQDAAAEKVYRELLSAQPQNPVFMNNLAHLLQSRGELEKAETLARRANELEADNGAMLDTLGWIKYRQGRIDQALDVMERAAMLAPEAANIQYHYGVVLHEAGRDSKARQALDHALQLKPEAPWAADARQRRDQLGG